MSVFNTALGAMFAGLANAAGVAVVYLRGPDWGSSVEATAIVGRTEFDEDDGNGAIVRRTARDLIFEAEALDLGAGAGPFDPAAGDRITEDDGVHTTTYEVVPIPGEGPFRRTGPQIRIHTQKLSVADAT